MKKAWEQRKLGEVAKIVGGGTPSTKNPEYWNGKINWYTPAEIGNNIYATSSERKITEEGLRHSSAKILPIETILFTSRAGIGKTAILAESAATNQGFQSIVPNRQIIDSYFLYSLSDYLRKYGETHGAGSTFVEISGRELAKAKIKLPKLQEQKLVSKLVKSINKLLSLQQRKLEQLKKLKVAMMRNTLANKNQESPVIRFNNFNDNWVQVTFKHLLNYERPDKYIVKNTDYLKQGIPVLTANKSFVLGYTNEHNIYDKGSAIIFDDFTLDNKFVNFPFMVKSSAIKILTAKTDYPLYFLYQILQNTKFIKEGHARHYISVVQKLSVKVPEQHHEQKKVSLLLKNLQASLELQQKKVTNLNTLKKFLLQKLFI